jgi:hypothetical protein
LGQFEDWLLVAGKLPWRQQPLCYDAGDGAVNGTACQFCCSTPQFQFGEASVISGFKQGHRGQTPGGFRLVHLLGGNQGLLKQAVVTRVRARAQLKTRLAGLDCRLHGCLGA